ncbi:response regulator transcription factor [Achromobacter xylosoxidans]|uniref:response regulator transcription factor n=1 Tax=Alcaligenes xylosoxydans xylosoxydans TaxID=85698 RepID=UPI001F0FD049|nr:response regulator transcription factor [Achromobacter xylosoxidans]MCH4591028.1 response regulator transcription factor [Achromobacter xylosoxidans]
MPGADGLLCIGLLEDDADFREELALGLGGYGFRVAFACDNAAAFYRRLQEQPCDIVILDAHLPGEDGFSVATRLRALSPVGIVMLTGRSALEDRVRGLEGGADVYMTKPVDLLELSSVIRSLARRMRLAKAPRPVDAETRAAADTSWSLQDGASLHLSAQERTFLMALMDAAGSAVSRQALAELFLPDSPGGFELRRIDVLVSRLRAKAQSAGLKLPVLSVRGQGYVFAA